VICAPEATIVIIENAARTSAFEIRTREVRGLIRESPYSVAQRFGIKPSNLIFYGPQEDYGHYEPFLEQTSGRTPNEIQPHTKGLPMFPKVTHIVRISIAKPRKYALANACVDCVHPISVQFSSWQASK
jgi:hypothetical protein